MFTELDNIVEDFYKEIDELISQLTEGQKRTLKMLYPNGIPKQELPKATELVKVSIERNKQMKEARYAHLRRN